MGIGVFKLLVFVTLIAFASGGVTRPQPKTAASAASTAVSTSKKPGFPALAGWTSQAQKWAAKAKDVVQTVRPTKITREFSPAEVEWSNALKLVYDALSSYTIQKDRALYNVKNVGDWGTPSKPQGLKGQINEGNLPKFLDQLQKTSPFPQKMTSADFLKILKNGGPQDTEKRLEELNTVIGTALAEDAQCQFDAAGKSIIVQGHSILLSKVMTQSDCWTKEARSLVLIASHTLFIDNTVVGSSLSPLGLTVYAYAPNWNNLNGNKLSFNLDGAKGDQYGASDAPKSGEPGKVGKPGKNAGNFVGVGNSFLGGVPLVSAKGGEGGDGQGGGPGEKGQDGRVDDIKLLKFKISKLTSLGAKIKATVVSEFPCEGKDYLNDGKDQKWECLGGPASNGKSGGNGGKSGLGGVGGNILFLTGDQKLDKKKGDQGPPGKPGLGGKGGKGGIRQKSVFELTTKLGSDATAEEKKQGWAIRKYKKVEDVCSTCEGDAGKDGTAGSEGTPEPPKVTEEFYIKYLPLFGTFARKRLSEIPTLFYPQVARLFSSSRQASPSKSATPALSSLTDLVTLIDLNSDLHLLRAQLSYFHDLKVMELQWPTLSEKDPLSIQFVLSPSYNALLRHILDKGKAIGATKSTDASNQKYLQALRYLYTAVYSRAHQQPSGMDSALVTDMEKYLDNTLQNFKTLQSSVTDRKKLKVIQETRDAYAKEIDAKFEEANNIVKNTLEKKITQTQDNLDSLTKKLLVEIQNLQGKGYHNLKDLEESRAKLKKQMIVHIVFGAVKLGADIAKCAGPIGQLAGSVTGQVAGLGETAVLGKIGDMKPLEIPQALLKGEKEFLTYFNTKKSEYKTLSTAQNYEAGSTLDAIPDFKGNLDNELKQVTKEIKDLAAELKGIKLKPVTDAPSTEDTTTTPTDNIDAFNQLKEEEEKQEEIKKAAANKLKKQLKVLDKKKQDLAKQGMKETDPIVQKLAQTQDYVLQGLGYVSAGIDIYKQVQKDRTAMKEVGLSIIAQQEQFKSLEDSFSNVEDNLATSLKAMQKDIRGTMEGLKNKSPVALEISKWELTKYLKKLQSSLSSAFTAGTASDSTVKSSFDTISETFDILIKVYDRMNEYEAQAKLANFIADINSAGFIQPDAISELGKAVQDTQFIIQANVLRTQYDLSLKSFKMIQFPFIVDFLKEMNVPDVLLEDVEVVSQRDDSAFYAITPNAPTESVVDQILGGVNSHLVDLNNKVKLSLSSIISSDELIAVNVQFDEGEDPEAHDTPGPFFTWKNARFGDDIKRLLKLEPITLLADIKDKNSSIELNGVKFKRLELHFAAKSESAEDQAAVVKLKAKLKGYQVHLTHSGHNYYRYGPRVYSTMIKQLPMFFNYVGKRGESVTGTNAVYNKLLTPNSPATLSPYTLWTIQLKKIQAGAVDPELEKASESVDLLLAGTGSHVTGERTPEELRLEQFYDRVEL